LEELRKRLEAERDRLAEEVFNSLLDEDKMRFMVVLHDLGMNRLPKKIEVPKSLVRATRLDGNQFELNLFDPVPLDSLNSLEREVATFLDEQSKLYFWYRNIPHHGYFVQGWQKSRIYADFIFTTQGTGNGKKGYRKVFVLETKGKHLKNENTDYKKSVFALCNEHAKRTNWNELAPTMRDKEINYEVVFQDEWQRRLNELLAE
jgi:type III restriction enzyme